MVEGGAWLLPTVALLSIPSLEPATGTPLAVGALDSKPWEEDMSLVAGGKGPFGGGFLGFFPPHRNDMSAGGVRDGIRGLRRRWSSWDSDGTVQR